MVPYRHTQHPGGPLARTAADVYADPRPGDTYRSPYGTVWEVTQVTPTDVHARGLHTDPPEDAKFMRSTWSLPNPEATVTPAQVSA